MPSRCWPKASRATADTCVYGSDARTLYDSLAATDKTLEFIRADQYLREPTGAREQAADLYRRPKRRGCAGSNGTVIVKDAPG